MRPLRISCLLVSWLMLALGGCGDDKSFVLVTVTTTAGKVDGFTALEVALRHVDDGTAAQLAYPRTPAAPASIDAVTAVTFSAGFSGDLHGELEIGVIPLDAAGAALGFGKAQVTIEREGVARAAVRVEPGALPPAGWPRRGGADAGASVVGPSPTTVMDPSAANRCDLAAPACAGGARCALACMQTAAAGVCAAAGTKQPGEACGADADCAAGSQCFVYGCATGAAKICGRTCTAAGACASGTTCFTPISCGGTPSGFKICSNTCDPTGAADTGCGSGLRCIFDELGFTECRCVAPTRTRGDGEACTVGADCKVGFTCVSNDAKAFVCRKICRLGSACEGGLTCDPLGAPAISATYGICE